MIVDINFDNIATYEDFDATYEDFDVAHVLEVNHAEQKTFTVRRVYELTPETAVLRYVKGDEVAEYPLRLLSERHDDGEVIQTWEIVKE